VSTTTDNRAVTSPEVTARLAAALRKLPTVPKNRDGIAAALAPTVAALIAEAQKPTAQDGAE
jgi:hypothetical protein